MEAGVVRLETHHGGRGGNRSSSTVRRRIPQWILLACLLNMWQVPVVKSCMVTARILLDFLSVLRLASCSLSARYGPCLLYIRRLRCLPLGRPNQADQAESSQI